MIRLLPYFLCITLVLDTHNLEEVNPLLEELNKDELIQVLGALGLRYSTLKDQSTCDSVNMWLRGDHNVLGAADGEDSRTWNALITALKGKGFSGVADKVRKVAS